jgi:hypothetical protein
MPVQSSVIVFGQPLEESSNVSSRKIVSWEISEVSVVGKSSGVNSEFEFEPDSDSELATNVLAIAVGGKITLPDEVGTGVDSLGPSELMMQAIEQHTNKVSRNLKEFFFMPASST